MSCKLDALQLTLSIEEATLREGYFLPCLFLRLPSTVIRQSVNLELAQMIRLSQQKVYTYLITLTTPQHPSLTSIAH